MPYAIVRFQDTPNPNAIKCVLDRSPGPMPRSYPRAADADDDPIAAALFRVPDVTNVLMHDGWITVGKRDDANWAAVKKGVAAALAAVP